MCYIGSSNYLLHIEKQATWLVVRKKKINTGPFVYFSSIHSQDFLSIVIPIESNRRFTEGKLIHLVSLAFASSLLPVLTVLEILCLTNIYTSLLTGHMGQCLCQNTELWNITKLATRPGTSNHRATLQTNKFSNIHNKNGCSYYSQQTKLLKCHMHIGWSRCVTSIKLHYVFGSLNSK